MVYQRISGFVPRFVLEAFRRQLGYNKIETDERKFVGSLVLRGLGFAVAAAAVSFFFLEIHPALVFIAAFFGAISLVYLVLKLRAESYGRFVENILPDALQLIASNMKSGLTTERSLFVASRPEFGPLQHELRTASKRISSGERVETALSGISTGIDSIILSKTIWLISQGIRSGGQIADLLFQLADDLKNQQALEEEARANISIYVILILFSAALGAPMLFGVSSFIVQVLTKQLSANSSLDLSGISASGNLSTIKEFAAGKREPIKPDFVINFSLIMLAVTAVFSSLTIGVMNSGRETSGLKYVLPIGIAGTIVFFGARVLLLSLFGNLI